MDFKAVCGICMIALISAVILKCAGSPLSLAVSAAAITSAAAFSLMRASEIVNKITEIERGTPAAEYFPIALKITAVALICEYCADICIETGEPVIGKIIVCAGRFEILLISMPIFVSLIDTVKSICA